MVGVRDIGQRAGAVHVGHDQRQNPLQRLAASTGHADAPGQRRHRQLLLEPGGEGKIRHNRGEVTVVMRDQGAAAELQRVQQMPGIVENHQPGALRRKECVGNAGKRHANCLARQRGFVRQLVFARTDDGGVRGVIGRPDEANLLLPGDGIAHGRNRGIDGAVGNHLYPVGGGDGHRVHPHPKAAGNAERNTDIVAAVRFAVQHAEPGIAGADPDPERSGT